MTGKKSRRAAARAAEAAVAHIVAPEGAEPGSDSIAASPAAAVSGPDHGAAADTSGTSFVAEDAVVRRTKDGWRVGSEEVPDLTCAMILADLLAAENGMPTTSPGKPPVPSAASETGRLRATVGQLEHALITRIRVEQAIGVLAERHRIKPRQAFEQLRDAARSRGRKVIDIAGDVVASATNPLLQLPDELSRPRSGPRRTPRQPSGAHQ
jgi:ANTAR domain